MSEKDRAFGANVENASPRDPADRSDEKSLLASHGAAARNLAIRVGTATIALPIVVWSTFSSPAVFWGLLAIAIGAGAREMAALVRARKPTVVVAGSLTVHVLCFPGWQSLEGMVAVALLVCAFERAALAVLVVIVLPFELLLLLHRTAGPGWVVLALAVTWLGDAGSYFVGRRFGRRKLAPTVSPNKTVEGAFGGAVIAVALALVVGRVCLPEVSTAVLLPLALLANVVGQLGDLAESWLKRSSAVKDSGALVPGYGGMLDKVDSLLAATPVLTLAVHWLELAPR